MTDLAASAAKGELPPSHADGRARSGELELHYRSFGSDGGVPVLIAHGMSYFSYDWIGVATALATDRHIVAFDQRGFGESDWSPDKDYSVSAFSSDIVAMLDHLGWRRAILMGHSMGGRNVTYCAAHNPERIAALVLVDWSPQTAPEGSKRVRAQNSGLPDAFASVEEAMRYFGKTGDALDDVRVRARLEAFLRPVPGGFAIKRDVFFRDQSRAAVAGGRAPGLVSDRRTLDMWEVIGRVTCPTLVVRGTRSDMFAAETADRVRAANPRVRIEEIDTGHDVAGDDPDGLVNRVRPFIRDISKEP